MGRPLSRMSVAVLSLIRTMFSSSPICPLWSRKLRSKPRPSSVNCQELYDSLQELQARGSLKVISTLAEELERYCLPWKAEQDAQRLRDEQERLAQQYRERRDQEARDE